MGADLSHGTVENDRVVCPFHHWQYDAGTTAWRFPTASAFRTVDLGNA